MKCLSFFFIALLFAGCPNTDEPGNSMAHLARQFFVPIPGSALYDWTHQDERPGKTDSLYTVTYIGNDVKRSVDDISPVYLFQVTTVKDATPHTFQNEYCITDSVVVSYGASAASDAERMILLRDTLRLGKKWQAASVFKTSDGVSTSIEAEIDAYYASIHIGTKDYFDVYRVTYRPIAQTSTVDIAYRFGARHIYYYARNVGKVMEIVYGADSLLVWKNELVLEH